MQVCPGGREDAFYPAASHGRIKENIHPLRCLQLYGEYVTEFMKWHTWDLRMKRYLSLLGSFIQISRGIKRGGYTPVVLPRKLTLGRASYPASKGGASRGRTGDAQRLLQTEALLEDRHFPGSSGPSPGFS